VAEVDGLAMLMDAVRDGIGATIQPGAALARPENASLASVPVADADAIRPNLIVSVSDDELSPAGLAARVVLAEVARAVVTGGRWPGATLR
jgi:LysR family tcuABC transcriptional regulator